MTRCTTVRRVSHRAAPLFRGVVRIPHGLAPTAPRPSNSSSMRMGTDNGRGSSSWSGACDDWQEQSIDAFACQYTYPPPAVLPARRAGACFRASLRRSLANEINLLVAPAAAAAASSRPPSPPRPPLLRGSLSRPPPAPSDLPLSPLPFSPLSASRVPRSLRVPAAAHCFHRPPLLAAALAARLGRVAAASASAPSGLSASRSRFLTPRVPSLSADARC